MSENMMNSDHKTSTPESRQGYDRTFGIRCRYHSTRPAMVEFEGECYCDECFARLFGSGSDE